MKAGVLHGVGGVPRREDFPDPIGFGNLRSPYSALAERTVVPLGNRAPYGQVVEWARSGEFAFAVERVPLSDVESAWQKADLRGRRIVVIPQ